VKNKFVVYTALFGNYDDLIDPKEDYNGCDFVCFTDQKHLNSDIWEIRIIEDIDLPLNMMNRRYKILSHLFLSEYDQSLYVDTNISIIGNPFDLVKKHLNKYNFVMPKHFERDCIYQESQECLIDGKSKFNETIKQMKSYKNEGYPLNFGLGENNIILRKHNEATIIRIMNDWWDEINTRTKRDQLSLGYVLWKNNLKFIYMSESARNNNNYFKYVQHNKFKQVTLKNRLKSSLNVRSKRLFIKLFTKLRIIKL